MTNEQRLAEDAAKIAVKKTFAVLGVDVDNPREVEDFRRDLRWAGDWRRAQGKGAMALVTAIALGLGGAFYAGIKMNIGG